MFVKGGIMKKTRVVVFVKKFNADISNEDWAAELKEEIEYISGNKKIVSVSIAPYLIGSSTVIVLLKDK